MDLLQTKNNPLLYPPPPLFHIFKSAPFGTIGTCPFTASPVMSHSGSQLLLAPVAFQLARVAVRDAVRAAHGLVMFSTGRTLAHRFPVPRPASGAEIAYVPRARVRCVLCTKK